MSVSVSILAGLRPGLLQKYEAAVTQQQKFAFLRAFLLDPEGLADVQVEAEFVDQAVQEDQSRWVQLPLSELRKLYTSEEQQRFLQSNIIDIQTGENHPQDPQGKSPEMRLYWHFQQNSDTSGNKRAVGTRVSGRGSVPCNKTARTSMGDALTLRSEGFGKGKSGSTPEPNVKGEGKKGKKGRTTTPKAGLKHMIVPVNYEFPFETRYILISFHAFATNPVLLSRRVHLLQAPKVKTPEQLDKEAFDQKLTAYQSQLVYCQWLIPHIDLVNAFESQCLLGLERWLKKPAMQRQD